MLQLIRELAGTGLSVVVVLHDLATAARFADRIALMDAGRLRVIGPPEAILAGDELPRAFGVDVRLLPNPGLGYPAPVFDRDASAGRPKSEL
ncbi:MAG: hypothetical protein QM582_12225 [Micropruina sp.]|uniref:hypothetical protein n=1 Tax=Micropruina sp. TaxID=2737536 RepID=UPI0039E4C102